MKTKMQKISYYLGVIALGTVLGLSLQFAKAWTEPSNPAPAGNVQAPVNIGPDLQVKSGTLTAGTLISPNICVGSSCRTTWPRSSQWTTSGSNIYYSGGHVGIGTNDTSTYTLNVGGNTRIGGDVIATGKIRTGQTAATDASNTITTKAYVDNAFDECIWRVASKCNARELMRGYETARVLCCGRTMPACSATAWKTISTTEDNPLLGCIPDNKNCDHDYFFTPGHYHLTQVRTLNDCTTEQRIIDGDSCKAMCPNFDGDLNVDVSGLDGIGGG